MMIPEAIGASPGRSGSNVSTSKTGGLRVLSNQTHHQPRSLFNGKAQILALAAVSLVLLYSVPSQERFLRLRSDATGGDGGDTNYGNGYNSNNVPADPPSVVRDAAGQSPFVLNIKENDGDSAEEQDGLKIAFLMSFPNSGTSYTTRLVRHLTETNTASNYGNENRGPDGESMPVFADQPTGPYWSDPTVHPEFGSPDRYVLTKTHCGSRCIDCGPYRYVETTFSFLDRCLTGNRVRKVGSKVVKEYVSYPVDRVEKAVHLIRNPFDNAVSRFHLETHEGKSAVDFPKTRDGFRAFCQRMNRAHMLQEVQALFLDNVHLKTLANVPCRADFIRYVQWHNLAFATAQDLDLDTYVLHYDWYATRFNQTAKELLDFLRLEPRGEPAPFVMGKVYANDHFTAEEREAVKVAMQAMASRTTWQHISRYFRDES